MRAEEFVRVVTPERALELANVWGIGADQDAEALVRALRAPGAWAKLRSKIRAAATREDIAQLCASPLEPVLREDLHDPAPLERIGLIAPADAGSWAVNLDLALSLLPSFPAEYGLALTLLARLSDADLQVVARALEVSPSTNRVDRLLAVSTAWAEGAVLRRKVAPLVEEERAVLREALAAGELDDDPAWELSMAGPVVSLEGVPSALRGLVVRYEHPALEVASRLLVPLEVHVTLQELLDTLPVPEATTKRPRARALGNAAEPKVASRGKKVAAAAPAITPPPELVARKAQVVAASALVDLGSEAQVRALREHWELWSDVISTFDKRRVVLKSGVDAAAWAQRAAIALADAALKR